VRASPTDGSDTVICFSCLFAPFFRPSTPNLVVDDERREILQSCRGGSVGSDSLGDEEADCQQDLWQLVLRQMMSHTRQRPTPINVEVSDNFTKEAFLQTLTASYNGNGVGQQMPQGREFTSTMDPFVITINTTIQSNMIASFVWGVCDLVHPGKFHG